MAESSRGDDHDTPHGESPLIRNARDQVAAARDRREAMEAAGLLQDAGLPDSAEGRSLPNYALERELHRGGQALVYLATQVSTGRRVAVKVFRRGASGSQSELARFEREVEVLSRLKHPNVVTIHDCGRFEGDVYLVMDYVAGHPLDTYMTRTEPTTGDALRLFVKICDGVNAAHLRGVIHRDLKPANIRVDETGEPRVLDFGLAKPQVGAQGTFAADANTMTGQFVGSLPWASPEQAEGRSDTLDVRADVYSLGVIFYQLLVGAFPYPVNGRMDEVVRNITTAPPARASVAGRSVRPDVETILLKCLAKEPERRYQNAGEVAADLRRYLAGEPILAQPASAWHRMTSFVRRRKALVGSVVTVFVALSTVTVGVTWAMFRARDAARQTRFLNEFMTEILTSVDKAEARMDLPMVEVLRAAGRKTGERFNAFPLLEADVLEMLGDALSNLNWVADAVPQQRRAYELRESALGSRHPDTLRVAGLYAYSLFSLQKASEAMSVAQSVVSNAGPELAWSEGVIRARRVIAGVHKLRLEFEDAEREYRQLLSDLRAHSPEDRGSLSGVAGEFAQFLDIKAKRLPTADVDKDLREAASLCREVIPPADAPEDRHDMNSLRLMSLLSKVLVQLDEFDEAEATALRVIALATPRVGDAHHVCDHAYEALQSLYFRRRQFAQAAEYVVRKVERRRHNDAGKVSVAVLASMADSLNPLEAARDAAKGEEYARVLYERFQAFDPSSALFYRGYLARFLLSQGKTEEAEAHLAAIQSAGGEPRHDVTAIVDLCLAGQAISGGDFERAENLLLAMHAREVAGSSFDTVIELEILRMYEAWGRASDAATWRERLSRPAPPKRDGGLHKP